MNRQTIEQELKTSGKVVFRSAGTSMLPLIREKRDLLEIEACAANQLKPYDIALFRRRDGQLVLHRLLKKEGDLLSFRGDNLSKEEDVSADQVLGKLTKIVRSGKEVSLDGFTMKWYGRFVGSFPQFKRVIMLYNSGVEFWKRVNRSGEESVDQTVVDLLYLMGCALNKRTPGSERMRRMNLRDVLILAKRHSVLSLLVDVLPDVPSVQSEYMQVLKRTLLFDRERVSIEQFLESEGIPYVLLKGIILKQLYPKLGMRYLSDNDIWIREADKAFVRDYMVRNGYTAEYYDVSNHDVYLKAPIYNFEFHNNLFREDYNAEWHQYYRSMFDRLPQRDSEKETSQERVLPPEDFYVYFIAHMYKHYSNSGIGLRSLADEFVVKKHLEMKDRDYVREELRRLSLLDFEDQVRELTALVFSDEFSPSSLSASQKRLLASFVSSNTYGTVEQRIANQFPEWSRGSTWKRVVGKSRYIVSRLFPMSEAFLKHFPLVYRHRVLLPLFWVWRFFRAFKNSGKRIIKEVLVVLTR